MRQQQRRARYPQIYPAAMDGNIQFFPANYVFLKDLDQFPTFDNYGNSCTFTASSVYW
jgi:hypothetical protein